MMPAPMTPADCDVRSFPYMPVDVARLLESDLFGLSTGDEFKAAFALWSRSWGQVPAASMPNDERLLARACGVSVSEWRTLAPVALKGWDLCSDGRLYHPVVAEKALTAWIERLSLQERSAKGNAAKYGRTVDGHLFAQAIDAAVACLAVVAPALALKWGKLPQGPAMAPTGSAEGSNGEGQNLPTKLNGTEHLPGGAANAAPADPNKEAWQRGVALLAAAGLTEAKARAFFGKLLKDNSLEARDLLPSVVKAEGLGTADPQGYLTQAAKAVAGRRGAQATTVPTSDEWTAEQWATAVRLWREGQGWSDAWGPPPDKLGCRAPAELLSPNVVPLRPGAGQGAGL
jgi:hypothetical protein